MNRFLKVVFAVCLAVVAGSASLKAQTVVLDGLGSSSLFAELGLAANSSSGTINAPCIWSENTNTVAANDFSVSGNPSFVLQDKGVAWVAWAKGMDGTCGTAGNIYAYLSTDSVVGNRCLYNSNLSTGRKCYISYPTVAAAPAALILPAGAGVSCGTTGECTLPTSVETALNSSTQLVNFAGTDIRPEDAEFAIMRAFTNCGSLMPASTQYLGLGYTNGSTIHPAVPGSTNAFNVINFALPSFFVTSVGAAPVIVVVNDSSLTGLHSFSNISVQALSNFLDGTYSFTGQVAATPTATGFPVTVYIREPLSGTYNTMEFNIPNTLTPETSQDVGLNQPISQRNCTVTSPWPVPSATSSTVLQNPLNFSTASGGARVRTIGTGQELSAVATNTSNSMGYGFWSASNFLVFSGVSSAKYYDVQGVDPLGASGTIPTTSAELANVSLATTANGLYPLWAMLRLVNVGTTQNSVVAALAASAQALSASTHPSFVPLNQMLVVHSHFPIPSASDGSGSTMYGTNRALSCSATEAGGDMGGVVIGLKTASLSQSPLTVSDQTFCTTTNTTGQTGHHK